MSKNLLEANPAFQQKFYFQFLFYLSLVGISIAINYFSNSQNNFYLIICFFLLATIGISHGSLDNQKGKFIFQNKFKKNWPFVFYSAYIATSICVLIMWLNFPLLSILFFFIIASFHFGHEDLELFINKDFVFNRIIYFFRGLLIISTPLYLNNQETTDFINILLLDVDIWDFNSKFFYNLFYSNVIILIFLQFLYLFLKLFNWKYFLIICIENLSIILIFNYLPLILAFTIYFCFMHSSKHILSLSHELDPKNLTQGIKKFMVLSLPLTVTTFLIAVIMLFYLSNDFSISNAMLKIIFIGLASLTLPHIMLEYIYGRTKKR